MLFQHTIDQVLSGEKTLTSRLVKPNQFYDPFFQQVYSLTLAMLPLPAHMNARRRILWQVGRTYAVQPGRGKPAVARIRVLAIKRYDVRDITSEEARCEGLIYPRYFWEVWIQMHDKPLWNDLRGYDSPPYLHEMAKRPAERYQAWQLRFELVSPRTRMDEPTGWPERDLRELGFNKLSEATESTCSAREGEMADGTAENPASGKS